MWSWMYLWVNNLITYLFRPIIDSKIVCNDDGLGELWNDRQPKLKVKVVSIPYQEVNHIFYRSYRDNLRSFYWRLENLNRLKKKYNLFSRRKNRMFVPLLTLPESYVPQALNWGHDKWPWCEPTSVTIYS